MTARRSPCTKSISIAIIIGALLGACTLGADADPDLNRVIKAYYAQHATEEDGKCRAPKIDTIQSHHPKEPSQASVEVVTIRYSYYDRHIDMDNDWGTLFHLSQPCGGIAERDFSLVRTNLGYRVMGMKGEQRRGVSAN